ncbi:MAG: hypothetical protein N3D73_00770 [Candidatus Diapherotrites archaeon]|nr:hypothetical protein [Candidatus Diapherotrites archaeon]
MSNIKKKLKIAKTTMRGKKRYLAFRVLPDSNLFSKAEVEEAIWNNLLSLYGIRGCAIIRPWLIYWDKNKNYGILRYSLVMNNEVRASFLFLDRISKQRVIVLTHKISGNINKLLNS